MAVTDWVAARTFLKLSGAATWTDSALTVDNDDLTFGTYVATGAETFSARFTNCSGLAALIPEGATINGIEFRYKSKYQLAAITETGAQVTLSGTTNGDDNASGAAIPVAADGDFVTVPASGGDTETWNHSPTVATRDAVTDSTFGIDLEWTATGLSAIALYIVQVRVYYTEASASYPDAPWLVFGVHPRGVYEGGH